MQVQRNQASERGLFTLSVRWRVLLTVLGAAILPLIVLVVVGTRTLTESIIIEVDAKVNALTKTETSAISEILAEQIRLAQLMSDIETIEQTVEASNQSWETFDGNINQEINRLDQIWIEASSTGNIRSFMNDVLNANANPVASQIQESTAEFTFITEILVTDAKGALVAASGLTSDYWQADEDWWQNAWNNGAGRIWVSEDIEFDESTGTNTLQIAVPITIDDVTIGILRVDMNQILLIQAIGNAEVGETGRILIIDENSHVQVATRESDRDLTIPVEFVTIEHVGSDFRLVDDNGTPTIVESRLITTDGQFPAIDAIGWYVVLLQAQEEVFAPVNNTINALIVPLVILLVIILVVGYYIATTLVRPVTELAASAEKIAQERDFSTRVSVTGNDEFGQLGNAFNGMASEVEDLIADLEARALGIQTVVDVSNQISTILDVNRLLQDVVDVTKERFGLYHAHVYLMDEDEQHLTLTAGAGHVGRQMVSERRIINANSRQSIVATAARDRRSQVVNNVTLSPSFLAHPLLPDTKSELAVPLVARGRVLGTLDVQSDEVDYFDEATLEVLEIMASQVATALSNAALYQQAEQSSRHEQALSAIDQEIQNAVGLDEMLQTTVRELGKALRVAHTAIELDMTPDQTNGTKNEEVSNV